MGRYGHHGDYGKYTIAYLKVAKKVNFKNFHLKQGILLLCIVTDVN